MVIDRDTAAFLFTIFPNLRWSVIGAAIVIFPLMYALWVGSIRSASAGCPRWPASSPAWRRSPSIP